jgi:ABC-type nitrate/sulfonate/bicarbonate transport system permease component
LLVVWDYVGQNRVVNPILLPPLRRVLDKFVQIVQTGAVYTHLAVTVLELLAGFAIAASAGLLIGYVIGRSRHRTVVFEPLLAGVFAIPIIIFLPIFLLFFGIGVESKIAFGATYAFFPIVLNTIGGISQVDDRYVRVARAMGASDRQMFRRVLLPAALPVIITGLRIGCIIGFLAIVGGEMIAGLQGLGSQIVRLGEGMNTAEMFAYIIFVIFVAAVLNFGLSGLQRWFSPAGEPA